MGAIKNKIAGTVKKIEGKLTGDKVRTAQGTAEKAVGDVEGVANRVVRKAKIGVAKVKARVAVARAKSRVRQAVR